MGAYYLNRASKLLSFSIFRIEGSLLGNNYKILKNLYSYIFGLSLDSYLMYPLQLSIWK